MTADDRRRLGRRLLREQNGPLFKGEAKAAYTAADVSQLTWKNATEGLSVKDHTIRRIVVNLWPEANGDWRRIPDLDPPANRFDAVLEAVDRAGFSPETRAKVLDAIAAEGQRLESDPDPDTPSEQGISESA